MPVQQQVYLTRDLNHQWDAPKEQEVNPDEKKKVECRGK